MMTTSSSLPETMAMQRTMTAPSCTWLRTYFSQQRFLLLSLLLLTLLASPPPCVAFQRLASPVALPQQQEAAVVANKDQASRRESSSSSRQQKLPLSPSEPAAGTRRHRRTYPIFLSASAGDEGLADSDLPMAVSVIGATTSAFVAGTFYVVLAWKRDALMVAFFVGSIANGFLSKILKRLINQSRPPDLSSETVEMSLKPSDGGMPSSHAMSLGFIGTFTALHIPWSPLPILAYVVVSLWYRVRVKLHTTAQILVGATVGSANALLFTNLVQDGLEEWLRQHVLDSTTGLLPVPLLVVPAVVGIVLVGSLERRIAHWLEGWRHSKAA